MTDAELMAVFAFSLTVLGTVFGVWKYLDGKLTLARKDTDAVLAVHKLHAAVTFVTKAGMQEQTAQIIRAIEEVGNRIECVHERLYENQPARRATRQ